MAQTKLSVEVNKFNKGLVGSASPVDYPHDAAVVLKNMVLESDGSVRKRGGLKRVSSFVADARSVNNPELIGNIRQLLGYSHNIGNKQNHLTMYLSQRNLVTGTPSSNRNSYVSALEWNYVSNTWRDVPAIEEGASSAQHWLWKISLGPYRTGRTNIIGDSVFTTYRDTNVGFFFDTEQDRYVGPDNDGSYLVRVRDSWGYWMPGAFSHPEYASRNIWNASNAGYGEDDRVYFSPSEIGNGKYVPPYRYSAPYTDAGSITYVEGGVTYTARKHHLSLQNPVPDTPVRGAHLLNLVEWGGSPFTVASVQSAMPVPRGRADVNGTCLDGILSSNRMWYWYNDWRVGTAAGYTAPLDRNKPDVRSMILFSQVIEGTQNASKCYSKNSPTSLANADPTEADGGVIVIDGSGNIIELIEYDNRIIVFAENGIWEISGPFSPISYSVRKITTDRLTDSRTVVKMDDRIMFMSESSLLVLAQDPRYGRLFVESVSSDSLSSLYTQNYKITPSTSAAFTAYDAEDGVAMWVSCDNEVRNAANTYKVLCYKKGLNAFYEYEFKTPAGIPNCKIVGAVEDPLNQGKLLWVTTQTNDGPNRLNNLVIGLLRETEDYLYDDFPYTTSTAITVSSSSFKGEIETGAASFGDASKAKDVPYLTVYMKQTETSYDVDGNFNLPTSCMMRVKWDFATSAATGKWGEPREVYRLKRFTYPDTSSFDYGYDVIISKNKLRGRGKALRINFTIPEGKTCHLYGWNFTLNANTEV